MKPYFTKSKRAISEILDPSKVGPLIKEHRLIREIQQKDLAQTAGISQRHLSFVEQGKAIPSADTLVALAVALQIAQPLTNGMLAACGFAPRYDVNHLDRILSAPTEVAVKFTLDNHDPLPAIVIDGFGETLGMNRGARKLIELLTGAMPKESDPALNWIDILCSERFDRSMFVNWEQIVVDSIKSLNSIYGLEDVPVQVQQAKDKLYDTLDDQGKDLVDQPGMHPLPVYEAVLNIHGIPSRWSITHLRFRREPEEQLSRVVMLLWIPTDSTSLTHAQAVFGLDV